MPHPLATAMGHALIVAGVQADLGHAADSIAKLYEARELASAYSKIASSTAKKVPAAD